MFLKKIVSFLLVIGFITAVFSVANFAQETTGGAALTETSIIVTNPDEEAKVIPASYQAVELVKEIGIGMFSLAAQVVFSPDQKVIYVADSSTREILAFNQAGDLLFRFGGQKAGYRVRTNADPEEERERRKEYDAENVSKIGGLMDITTDAKGNIYVVDWSENGVKIFSPEGKYLFSVRLQDSLQKNLPGQGASGVAVNSRGDIYVTDSGNGRIQINDMNGKYKYQITKFKNKKGEELAVLTPGHPKFNSLDEVYVIDPLICRVHRFNAKGNYLGSFGYMGDGAGGFNAPNGLAIDKLERLYVSDRGNSVIQVFSKEGTFLYALCDENGAKLNVPILNAISIDRDNLIYISCNDRKGSHVKVFRYLTKKTK
ncbi:MAG: 6-bladed beta-propeller [bacterium]|nr:6-bladed beta-propeller [bacterium]